MQRRKVLQKPLASPARDHFADVRLLVAGYGMARVSVSHHNSLHPEVGALENLREVGGEAKPYQVRQFLKLVECHNLTLEADE